MKPQLSNNHSHFQSPRSFWPTTGIERSGLLTHWKSAIHGLLVKSGKSDWLRIWNKYSSHTQKIGSGQRSITIVRAGAANLVCKPLRFFRVFFFLEFLIWRLSLTQYQNATLRVFDFFFSCIKFRASSFSVYIKVNLIEWILKVNSWFQIYFSSQIVIWKYWF